jgi:hypothetical protein
VRGRSEQQRPYIEGQQHGGWDRPRHVK